MQRRKNAPPHLILFTRWPEAGNAKTRLIPALGAKGAARAQQRMSETAFATLVHYRALTGTSLEVCFNGGNEASFRNWLPDANRYTEQVNGDLGDRLARAFAVAFDKGHGPVVIVGADCPTLAAQHLAAAFRALADHDLVLGPATDGGYYLIGMDRLRTGLFADIPWSTATVLQATMAKAQTFGLHHHLLETLPDVDRPADLTHLGHHPGPQ